MVDASTPDPNDASLDNDAASPMINVDVCARPESRFLVNVLKSSCGSSSFGSDKCVGEVVNLLRASQAEERTILLFKTIAFRFQGGDRGINGLGPSGWSELQTKYPHHLTAIRTNRPDIEAAKTIVVIGTSTYDQAGLGLDAGSSIDVNMELAAARANYGIALLNALDNEIRVGRADVPPKSILKVTMPESNFGRSYSKEGLVFGVDERYIGSGPAVYIVLVPCN